MPAHGDIEDALIEQYQVPAEARSVSVSLDRVSVPMEEPQPRPVGRPKRDAPKQPVARNFRMAYCASVTLHDQDGDALHTVRYGRMPQGDAKNLCEGLAADVAALLAKRPELKVAALCDGAAELWNLLAEPLGEDALGTEVHKLVDLWHLLEKLGRAAAVIHGSASADEVLKSWRLRLLNSSRAAEGILAELKQSRREHVQVGESRPVHDAITYLENNGERMDYAAARRRGLPVGSGNVEATCKSLVEVRMKRPGARWKEDSGEHVIQLRAVALSDRWDAAMELTLKPLRKAVRDHTITCPGGETERIRSGSVVEFDPEACDHCELRAKCTAAEVGTGRTVNIAEDERLQRRLRKVHGAPFDHRSLDAPNGHGAARRPCSSSRCSRTTPS